MVKQFHTRTTALASEPLSASELIRQLNAAIETHGDIPVRVWDEQMDAALPFILEPPSEYARRKYPDVWPCLTIRRTDTSINVLDEPGSD
jgi:hypothetical protein